MSACGHDHAPHGHHDHAAGASERAVAIAAALIGSFMLVEVAGGVISGSLALLADAGHMLTDFASLAMAWFAFRLARRPADWQRSYGYDRFKVLVAFVNGVSLIAIAAWITIEAALRLAEPAPILAGTMLWVAIAGLVVNIAAFLVLTRSGDDLNLRAATLHVMGDMLGSVGAILAALIIMGTGFVWVDPVLSVIVAALIVRSALGVTREAAHILLEGTPHGVDEGAIEADLETLPGVRDVHHVHCWSITGERRVATLHACITDTAEPDEVRRLIKRRLVLHHAIAHATVEIEHGECVGGDCVEAGCVGARSPAVEHRHGEPA